MTGIRPSAAEDIEQVRQVLAGVSGLAVEQVRHACDLRSRSGNAMVAVARRLGVAWSRLHGHLPELVTCGRAGSGATR